MRIIHFSSQAEYLQGPLCLRGHFQGLLGMCQSTDAQVPQLPPTSTDQLVQTVQGCMLISNPPTSGPTRCKPMLFKGQW